jgi:hypothetical protein
LAICLIANAKKGILFLYLRELRKVMLGEKYPLLKGVIEIDETYIG